MANLGTDAHWSRDAVTSRVPWTTGRLALVLALARRLEQPANSLEYWPGYGEDVRSWLGGNIKLSDAQLRIERQFVADERVETAIVTANRLADGTLDISCLIDDGDGVFDFVLSASDAAVSLISLQGQAING
jgi:hypothetical protein